MKLRLLVLLLGFSCSAFAQRFLPYAGLHLSGDAGMEYINYSLQAGVDYRLKNGRALSFYVHRFTQDLSGNDGSGYTVDRLKIHTLALLYQLPIGKSFYLGGGPAFQWKRNAYIDAFGSDSTNFDSFTGALRFGGLVPLSRHLIGIELNLTGPYVSKQGDPPFFAQYTEVLTQLSIGARFILNGNRHNESGTRVGTPRF